MYSFKSDLVAPVWEASLSLRLSVRDSLLRSAAPVDLCAHTVQTARQQLHAV